MELSRIDAFFLSREKAISDILARHAGDFDGSARAFLVEQLHVPEVYMEKAANTYHAGDASQSGDDSQEELME